MNDTEKKSCWNCGNLIRGIQCKKSAGLLCKYSVAERYDFWKPNRKKKSGRSEMR